MKLNTLMTAVLTLLVAGFLALPQPAEAKRFGGGGNVGRQYSTPAPTAVPRQAQAPGQSQGAYTPGQRMPQPSGASRWLGPLAGLAAGGLLASLFFGDAFSGFQAMDLLLIVALAVGAYFLLKKLRGGRPAGARPAGAFGGAAPASASAYQRQAPVDFGGTSGGFGSVSAGPVAADEAPSWLDRQSFAQGAKSHFIRLQAAWDRADFQEIAEYATPQMLAELQRERLASSERQSTEVVRLDSQLISVQRDGSLAVASLLFSGLIREDEQGAAKDFREIWHVQHAWDSPQGDWLIAGIQQA